MGMKKITKAIEQAIDRAEIKGYDAGFEDGFAEGSLHADEQWGEGAKAERQRIVELFRMLCDNELEHGTGTRAKFWKEASDIVKVADELEVYDEEGEYLG